MKTEQKRDDDEVKISVCRRTGAEAVLVRHELRKEKRESSWIVTVLAVTFLVRRDISISNKTCHGERIDSDEDQTLKETKTRMKKLFPLVIEHLFDCNLRDIKPPDQAALFLSLSFAFAQNSFISIRRQAFVVVVIGDRAAFVCLRPLHPFNRLFFV